MKKAFIIDDNPKSVAFMSACLKAHFNIDSESAKDGESAKAAIQSAVANGKEHEYGLVVLELLMKDVNGADLCGEMILHPKLLDIPVLLISMLPVNSKSFQESLKKHPQFSVVKGTLEKPFTEAQFEKKVEELLRETV